MFRFTLQSYYGKIGTAGAKKSWIERFIWNERAPAISIHNNWHVVFGVQVAQTTNRVFSIIRATTTHSLQKK